MKDNPQTADLVKDEIEKDIFILDLLYDGLINVSALARKMLPRIRTRNKKATVESISITIKRYISSRKGLDLSKTLKKIISNSQIVMKDNISHLTFSRSEEIVSRLNKISQKIKWDKDEVFLINQGPGEITAIIDEYNFNYFFDIEKKVTEKRDSLVLISIKETPYMDMEKGIDTPGLYAYFINRIARKGINIIEVISTSSQVSFLIDETDFTRAYNTINESIRYCRESV
ncbi:MAG: hypothetical protein KKF44_08375 [Nanoarchaeota archaeon]|nr:hypothetical protein [Nanoarchaeota archaeon]